MLFRSKLIHLLVTVGTLLIQMPAQVARLSGPEGRQAEFSSDPQPSEDGGPGGGAPDGGGAPPAGEMTIGSGGMAFVIPGVINLEELSGTGVLFGGGFSQGYGWIQGQPTDSQGSISVVQPYAALFQTGRRHKLLFEYSPTVDLFNRGEWDGSVLHRAGAKGYTLLSERWSWRFSTYGTDGLEYLRMLSGLAIGQYSGWLTFLAPGATARLATGSTGFAFRRTPQQEFSFTVDDTYSSLRHGPHYDAGSARVQMTSDLARNSSWHLYAQANRSSNQPGCTRVGGGVGFVWRANASTTLSLEGGPEYGGGKCFNHITANFGGSLAQHFSPRTVLYLSAARDQIEPYLLQSQWTDVFSTKLWRKTSQNTNVAIGSGYARSSDIRGEPVARYRGFLVFSEFNWRLSDSVSFVGTYRYFKRDIGSIGLDDRHSWVFGSIVWHPVSRSHRRS